MPKLPTPHFTASSAMRCRMNHPRDDELDFETPITAMIWIEDDQVPLQISLYPREDMRVRLSDHRVALAAAGFKEIEGKCVQHFVRKGNGRGVWTECAWDTPLRVFAVGDALLLSHEDVESLQDFDLHEAHMPRIFEFGAKTAKALSIRIHPTTTMLARTSTQQARPATEALARRIRRTYPKDYLLDFSAPVTVVIWTGRSLSCFPREDGRLRFADNYSDLETFDINDLKEEYFKVWVVNEWGMGTWEKGNWNTPLRIPAANALLIRDMDVEGEIKDFEIYERHLS
ncbi:hypothetical protein C8J57DRAFT_1520082 [Mycena rebaudengoi]|nr:hypothetical protein C8J57DRAFT_1520082 [Mycena rebaudengoi]